MDSTENSDTGETKEETSTIKVTVEAAAPEASIEADTLATLATNIELKEKIEDAELKSEIKTEKQITSRQDSAFMQEMESEKQEEETKSKDSKSNTEANDSEQKRKAAALKAKIEAEELAIAERASVLRAAMEAFELVTRKKIAMENAKKEERHVHDIVGGGTHVMHLLRQFTFRYPPSWPVRRVIAAAEEDAAAIEADTVVIEALATVGLGVPDLNLLKGLVPQFEPRHTTLEDVYQTVRWKWIRELAAIEEKKRKSAEDPDAPELQTKYKSDILEILTESGIQEVYFEQILTELLNKVPGSTIAQVRLHAFRALLLMSQDGTVTINQSGVDSNFMVKHNR